MHFLVNKVKLECEKISKDSHVIIYWWQEILATILYLHSHGYNIKMVFSNTPQYQPTCRLPNDENILEEHNWHCFLPVMVNFLPSTDSCGIYYSPKYQTGIRFLMEPKEKNKITYFSLSWKETLKLKKNSRSNLSSPAAENFLSQLLIGVLCEKSSHSREILLNVEGSIVKKTMAPLCSQITGKYHMFLSKIIRDCDKKRPITVSHS